MPVDVLLGYKCLKEKIRFSLWRTIISFTESFIFLHNSVRSLFELCVFCHTPSTNSTTLPISKTFVF